MNNVKKILSIMLCICMMFSSVQIVNATETEGTEQYDIYPIVRDISYDGTEFYLDSDVNVVYEEGIDDATKSYLEEVLTENDMTFTAVAEAVDGESNILLGVNGSNGVVDTYENTVTLTKEDLYEQFEGYFLEAKDNQITIVGGDSDAVFRGIATLKMMLSSFEDNKLLGAHIEDYAGIEYRGFIEGFYGGWDYQTRADLMEFAKDVKMNMYVYASKTDTYHTSNWGVLYPDDQIAEIEELVKIGQETKCYYVWSVHLGSFFSGLDISTNPDLYETRYNQLVAKFTQLYDVGVRKFDILNDDFGSGSHADVVTVLNRLTEEFIEPKGCDPITYCPQGYNKSWSGDGTELDALAALDDSIILYWTGDDVNSPITQSTVDYVGNRTGQPVSFWLNYPVNEHAKSGIFLGNIDHYARDGVTGLRAAVSNPSRFGYSNKVALFQLAALFWNNSNYSEHSENVWLDSFNYLEEGVEEVYRTIGRNVANCPGSSRVGAGFPESEYIKENLENIIAKVNAGEPVEGTEDAEILLAEFENILNAIEEFKADCENTVLVSELTPWLNSLTDVTTASLSILNSIIALENEDASNAWSEFAVASKALQTWDSYQTCSDLTNSALAGSKRLQPFASQMISYVKTSLTPLFDSEYTSTTLYAVLGGEVKTHDDNAAKMFDGDETTYAQWNVNQKQNDYFGVDLGSVVEVTDIRILQANSDTHHDYFHKAVLEYSEDGVTFTQLGEQYNDTYSIELDNLNIQARYVRLRLVETGTSSKADYWTHVREFTVNEKAPEGNRIYTNVEAYKQQPLTIDGKEYSVADLDDVTLESGEYIGIKFLNLSNVSLITKEGTGMDGLTLEVSENGTQWEEVTDLSAEQVLKYVRLVNKTTNAVTFDLTKLGVAIESVKANGSFLETNLTNGIQQGSWENVFDGDLSTFAWTNEGQAVGDYITFDLGSVISLYDVTIYTPDGNPRFYNAQIQISTDKSEWQTIATVENDNSVMEVPYRYVKAENLEGVNAKYLRIYITGSTGYYLKLHEIVINETVDTSADTEVIKASFGSGADNAIDGSLSTLFSGTATTEDYVEYKLTDATRYETISILQDPNSISNAVVKILTDEGYAEIGLLDESAKQFDLDAAQNVYALRIEFTEETDISIYEIYLDEAAGATDDIGEYVDPIIIEGIPVAGNLTPGKTITVSGTSDGNKDYVNDGDTSTKWDSNAIKSGQNANAQDTGDSWIYVDLGNEKTSIFDAMSISYFNKIYPTIMEIQISNDGTNWITVNELTSDHNGATYPVVTQDYEPALTARYVRLYFSELNTAAAGNGVGITEWEITGVEMKNVSVKEVQTFEKIKVDVGTTLETLALEDFVTVKLTHETAGDYEVTVPVSWNTDAYDGETSGTYTLEGTLNLPETVANEMSVSFEVQVGEDILVEGNLAPGKTITVSGTSDGNKDNVNDGDTSTKWDSDFIKSGTFENAQDIGDSWIYIDLGNEKTSVFDATTIKYYNKIYPTLMQIQISNDGTNWITINELTRDHNASTHPVITDTYETPYTARYVRLYFEELNNAAGGNGIGITEWEINGFAIADLAVKSVETFEDKTVELNTSADTFELKDFVKVVLTHEQFGDYEVNVPITWDTSAYDATAAGTYAIEGTLNLPETVANAENKKAVFHVIIEAEEEPVDPPVETTPVTEVFVDVAEGAWYVDSVQYVYDEGIIVGDGDVFAPNDATTRAMVAVILYRLAGSPEMTEADYAEYNKFTDLPAEHLWYSDAVAWALKEGVSTGDDANMLYNPTSSVTREQLALFLWRYAKYTGEDVTVTATEEELFGGTYVNNWAKEGFLWAIDRGIIKGAESIDSAGNIYYDLLPQGGATRAQFARVLHRYLGGEID